MQSTVRNFWRNTLTSFWFVPSLAVVGALVLSTLLVEVDGRLGRLDQSSVPWLFGGTADAARSVLSTIAGSLITVISIAFSLTVIALQQASSQFSPRVLRRFTGDRMNQVVLGAYIGTFVYALMVLRQVRSDADGAQGFVPALSVSVAIALAIVCVVLLIFFIHHISQVLQVDVVQRQIHDEMLVRLDDLYPSMIGTPIEDDESADVTNATGRASEHERWEIRSDRTGFVRSVDEAGLLDADLGGVHRIWIRPRVGSFVAHDDLLATIEGGPPAEQQADGPDEVTRAVREAVVIDATRSEDQDLLFDVRQLVDIALRALSPGVNDPTTAEHALYYLGDMLGRLGRREFPSSVRTASDGGIRIVLNRPVWDDFVAASFDQIRRSARHDVHVMGVLRDVLGRLERVLPPERLPSVRAQLADVSAEQTNSRRALPGQPEATL